MNMEGTQEADEDCLLDKMRRRGQNRF